MDDEGSFISYQHCLYSLEHEVRGSEGCFKKYRSVVSVIYQGTTSFS